MVLKEYFESGSTMDQSFWANSWWETQTFTVGTTGPNTSFTIDSVKLYLKRLGTVSGNLNVVLNAVDGFGKPTGSALSTGTILASSISTGSYA